MYQQKRVRMGCLYSAQASITALHVLNDLEPPIQLPCYHGVVLLSRSIDLEAYVRLAGQTHERQRPGEKDSDPVVC